MAGRDPLEPPAARDHLTDLASVVGHVFADPGLLAEALTHRSAAHGRRARPQHQPGERRGVGSNERLEFIGDRVLGLLMAEWLIERFPDEQEGELGPRQAHLVSRAVLAQVASAAGLADALEVAPNEARAGVRLSSNVVADATEAVLGALYMDGGLEAARRFVRQAWAPVMDAMGLPPKDPKTVLQEWLMARGRPLPGYELTDTTGPSHAPSFSIRVRAAGHEGVGEGASKREAERAAAADLLARLA